MEAGFYWARLKDNQPDYYGPEVVRVDKWGVYVTGDDCLYALEDFDFGPKIERS